MHGFDSPTDLLRGRINLPDIRKVVEWALEDTDNLEHLYSLTRSADHRQSVNALWCLSHLPHDKTDWLQSRQNEMIDHLLAESHKAKKRILLQLLREQTYDADSIRSDFIDYCFSKINSECEPYAIRCFSLYCAFKMCRFFPELITELELHIDMLSSQDLSPGLLSALHTTRRNIEASKKRSISKRR